MNSETTKYTPGEVLATLIEEYRIWQQVSPQVFSGHTISFETDFYDYLDIYDIRSSDVNFDYLVKFWNLSISENQLRDLLKPFNDKTLGDLCNIIARYGTKADVEPVTFFGNSCINAGLFKHITARLSERGYDMSQIRPSTPFKDLMENTDVISEVALLSKGKIGGSYKQSTFSIMGGYLILAGIILGIVFYFSSLPGYYPLTAFIFGCILLSLGDKQEYRSIRFDGISTFADAIRKLASTSDIK